MWDAVWFHMTLLDRLKLKIPWKNLYNDPVIIEVDGVYVLAGPAAGKEVTRRNWDSTLAF